MSTAPAALKRSLVLLIYMLEINKTDVKSKESVLWVGSVNEKNISSLFVSFDASRRKLFITKCMVQNVIKSSVPKLPCIFPEIM